MAWDAEAGEVYACGWNTDGQLGDGTTDRRGAWTRVLDLPPTVVKVVTKADTSFALTSACCLNSARPLARQPTPRPSDPAPTLTTPNPLRRLYLDADDGKLFAWGNNEYGQTGVPDQVQEARGRADRRAWLTRLPLSDGGTWGSWGEHVGRQADAASAGADGAPPRARCRRGRDVCPCPAWYDINRPLSPTPPLSINPELMSLCVARRLEDRSVHACGYGTVLRGSAPQPTATARFRSGRNMPIGTVAALQPVVGVPPADRVAATLHCALAMSGP